MEITIEGLETTTYAIIMLFIGKWVITRSPLLQKYSIPEPLIGGMLFATGVAVAHGLFDVAILLDSQMRDIMLVLFFTGIGLKADIRTLISGGRPLLILLALASCFILLQNLVGVSVATLFGLEPLLGLMGGSIALIGGVGTTVAWEPIFSERFGLVGSADIGFACNTLGLIAACVIGGPIARYLITRHQLTTGSHEQLDIGICHDQAAVNMDHYSVLFALGALFVGVSLGYALDELLEAVDFQMPLFVSCLIGGIVVKNVVSPLFPALNWPGSDQGLALIMDICLGLFLTVALMGMQFWVILNALGFVLILMMFQVLLTVLFILLLVFRLMGKDYEAAVICSGFGGITLGSTATAIVNMTAVATQYGAAHRAFIIVPLVAGFFIDIVNALVINQFIRWLG